MAKLTEEQKSNIREIEKQSTALGLDPNFGLAIAGAESDYRHIPASDPKSTAHGVFQVNRATAKANGYDYDEMIADPKKGIEVGLKNLIRHASNPLLQNDPVRIVAAHRLGENSDFAKTGDQKFLTPEIANYIADVGERLPTAEFPQNVLVTSASEAPSETPPEGSTEGQGTSEYGGTGVGSYKDLAEPQSDPAETGSLAGAVGLLGGATYLAKKPVIGVMQKAGLLPGGQKVSDLPFESQPQSRPSLQRYANSQLSVNVPLADLERLTGGTPIRTPKEVQQAIAKLHAVEEIPATREPRYKFVDGKKTQVGFNTVPAVPAKPQVDLTPYIVPPSLSERTSEKIAKSPLSSAVNTVGSTLASSPVRGGLTAYSAGYNAQDAFNKAQTGDKTGAALSGLATVADVGSLVPKIGPVASTVSAAIDAQRRAQKKDYVGALTSGLGAVAPYAAPFVFGPQVGIPAGIATAVGAPFVNEFKDYLMRQYGPKPEAKP
jgi:hypothetical protein